MKKLIKIFAVLMLFICSVNNNVNNVKAAAQQVKPGDFGINLDQMVDSGMLEHKSYTDTKTDVTMKYWFHAPEDYKTKKYPVITFFHGYGEGGDGIVDPSGLDKEGNDRNNINANAGIIYSLLTKSNLEQNPCIIIAPQTPYFSDGTDKSKWVDLGDGSNWNHSNRDMDTNLRTKNLETAFNIINSVEEEYNADPNRLYLTGLSMGGMAVWDLGTRNADKFAAIAPICGIGDLRKGELLKDMPIKTFHGTKDNVVTVESSRNMYSTLAQYGNITYTEYPDEFHSSWNVIYGKDNVQSLVDWMFNQSKDGPINGEVDSKPLADLIDKTKQVDANLYSQDTWLKIEKLCKEAKEIIKNGELTKDNNYLYCKEITQLLLNKDIKENIARSASISASTEAVDGSSIKGLNDGIMQDVRENFTIFSNSALPTITCEWNEPQTITELRLYTFVAKKFGPQKYELLYTIEGENTPISLGERKIEWLTDSNQDYENNTWKFDQPINNVKKLELKILEGGGTNQFCTIQELEIYNNSQMEFPSITGFQEFTDVSVNKLAYLTDTLPKYTTVSLSNNDKVTSSLQWDLSSLNENSVGEFQISGQFILPNGYQNNKNIIPTINVSIIPNKEALQTKIAYADSLIESEYTASTWQKLELTLTEAKIILNDSNASQNKVDNILKELDNAINNLVEISDSKINKTMLQIAVSLAKEVTDEQLSNVVDVVVKEFKVALAQAKVILADDNATQGEVDKAFDRLAKAMHMLEFFKGDKQALNEFINKVKDLTETEYTADTWKTFQTALDKANEVYKDVNAMEEEVNHTYSELVKAFVNLRYKPNKDLLTELVNKANSLDAANYSVESWARVAKALNDAKAVLENPEATEAEVNNANNALTKALSELVETTNNPVNTETLVKPGDSSALRTGDDSLVGVLTGLGVVSLAGIMVNRKRKREQ